MRTKLTCATKILILAILLSACNFPAADLGGTATAAPTLPRETVPATTPAPTNTAVTEMIPGTATPQPNDKYSSEKYMFEFQIPPGWSLEEFFWEEIEGPTQMLEITKGRFRIVIQFKTVFEQVMIGPRGLGGYDAEIVKLEEIRIFDKEIAGYSHKYQGTTKRVFYSVSSNELRLFAGLTHETSPDLDFTWENIEIPLDIQSEFISMLGSFRRTGTVALPESVALLAEIPLILPLEKIYYSQIYDTDVANACGPTAALMVLDYYGLENSLDMVIQKLRALASPGAFDPGCYTNTICTSPEALTMLLYDYGLQVNAHENWTLPEIFAVVSRGHPIIVDILWSPETASLGHFVVVYGVDLNEEMLYYHDPYRGRELSASWDDFASLWEGRVDIGDPLKPEGHRFWGLEIQQPVQDQ